MLRPWIVDGDIGLGYEEDGLVPRHRLIEGQNRLLPPHVEVQQHPRKHHQPPQSEQGQFGDAGHTFFDSHSQHLLFIGKQKSQTPGAGASGS